jgi:hypothetical protein
MHTVAHSSLSVHTGRAGVHAQASGYGLSEAFLNELTHLVSEDWQVYIANQQLGLWDQFRLGVRHFEVPTSPSGVCRVRRVVVVSSSVDALSCATAGHPLVERCSPHLPCGRHPSGEPQ